MQTKITRNKIVFDFLLFIFQSVCLRCQTINVHVHRENLYGKGLFSETDQETRWLNVIWACAWFQNENPFASSSPSISLCFENICLIRGVCLCIVFRCETWVSLAISLLHLLWCFHTDTHCTFYRIWCNYLFFFIYFRFGLTLSVTGEYVCTLYRHRLYPYIIFCDRYLIKFICILCALCSQITIKNDHTIRINLAKFVS